MELINPPHPQTSLPHLPDELWLEVLAHLDWLTLWQTRAVHPKFRVEAERIAIASVLPNLSLSTTYTLGSGTRHRWYDVRATITLSFAAMNTHNPEFALYQLAQVHPTSFHDRALEKWRPMCSRGLDAALDWQISDPQSTCTGRLGKLVAADDGGIWCDWRELMLAWVQKQRAKHPGSAKDEEVWSGGAA